MLAIPLFFQLLTALAVLGSTVLNIRLVIGLSPWMATARVVRSGRVTARHLLLQALPSMLVAWTLGVGQAILAEAALS